MRKEYRKAVRELFTRGMGERLPRFEPLKVKAAILFGGETVFRWQATPALHCFVLLVPDGRGHQAFTVEFAWSDQARFPEVSAKPTIMLGPDDPAPLDVAEGIVRVGDLVSRSDLWWQLPDPALDSPGDLAALQRSLERIPAPEARTQVADTVSECLDVVEGAVDFFERLAAM